MHVPYSLASLNDWNPQLYEFVRLLWSRLAGTPYQIILRSTHVNIFSGIISWIDFSQAEEMLARSLFEKQIILFREKTNRHSSGVFK